MPAPKQPKRKKPVTVTKSDARTKNLFLTAAEACAFLGVKSQTLYAYVSRGQLRAEARPGTQGHLYPRSEVESLLARSRARSGHGATAASAMRWGEPILDSAITNIQNDMVYYRGHALSDLIRDRVPFENVAELLWSGELPSMPITWSSDTTNLSRGRASSSAEESGTSVARRLLFRVSEVALADLDGRDELLDESLRRARHLVLSATSELFETRNNKQTKIRPKLRVAEAIVDGLGLRDNAAALSAVDAALIASADHELNASTFAARVAASTGADLYACILAGVAAFSGRHHGLSPVEAFHFVTAASSQKNVGAYLTDAIASDRGIPGFGHPLYPNGDPRASLMIDCARSVVHESGGEAQRRLDTLFALIAAAKNQGLQPPNLDLGLVAVALALGLPDVGASSLFVLGRIAGWTAHVIEQRQQGFLLRPRARYVGRAPVARK